MSENDETDMSTESGGGTTATQRRKKSTGFPVVSLAEAAEILKEAGKYGFEHPTAAFASYMGHSTTNSGAFRQRLAAFRDWKLIAGRGDSLAMTDIARMIALPTDDAAERRALQAAFVNCAVFFKLYEQSAKGQPLAEERLGGRAVHELGVAPSSKDKFVQSFADSASVAGLAQRTDDGLVLLALDSEDEEEGETSVPRQPPFHPHGAGTGGDTSPAVRPVSQRAPAMPVVHQTWDIAGGRITFEIRTAEPLPASAFATVGEVVASLERLAETLAPAPSTEIYADESED